MVPKCLHGVCFRPEDDLGCRQGINQFIYLFIYLFIHPINHSFIHSFIHSIQDKLLGPLNGISSSRASVFESKVRIVSEDDCISQLDYILFIHHNSAPKVGGQTIL